MGFFERLLRPFRRAPAPEPDPEPSPEQEFGVDFAEPAPTAAERARSVTTADRRQAATPAAPARPARPPRPARPSKARKARKAAAPAPAGPARPAGVEVLPVEEAERRYRALLDAEGTRPPSPPPPREAEAPQAPPPTSAPRPARERRRAPAALFERLLARADALLAVAAAEPAHLAAARRELAADWEWTGPPEDADAARLLEARDRRLSAFDERLRAAREERRAKEARHVAEREHLVAEARALAEAGDLRGAGPAMGQLRARLRAAGPVAPDAAARLDAAFAEAERGLAARRSAERAGRESERAERLEALDRLVAQAEALLRARDPEAAAERAKALQGEWKQVRVPGPRAGVDERWARFRAACDAVFSRRSEAREAGARAAVERLEQIVAEAEAAAAADDVPADVDERIRRWMADWKRAGRAPREAQDAQWERLQRAFDALRSPGVALPPEEPLEFRPFASLAKVGRDE
jgi:exonuclease SbcC